MAYIVAVETVQPRMLAAVRKRVAMDRIAQEFRPALNKVSADLEVKLSDFQNYYNRFRVHGSLENQTPIPTAESRRVNLKYYAWQKHSLPRFHLSEHCLWQIGSNCH